MNTEDLKPGQYRVAKATLNPWADKRISNSYDIARMPKWWEGMVLFYGLDAQGFGRLFNRYYHTGLVVTVPPAYRQTVDDPTEKKRLKAVEALVAVLEPEKSQPITAFLTLHERGSGYSNLGTQLLDKLVNTGVLSVEQVKAALAALEADWDAEEAERVARIEAKAAEEEGRA